MQSPLLRVQNLQVAFETVEGTSKAVSDISFDLSPGETLGIVGESGGGKSVVSLAIMGLIPSPPGRITRGEIRFLNKNLLNLSVNEMRGVRGNEISMIFQEPMTCLNPLHTCGKQIREPLILHQKMPCKQAASQAVELLRQVGIAGPRGVARMYPHQISGGMRQRVMIAMALACRPKLLIADEPTTALDVTIEAQIIELMKRLKQEINAGIIMISHNLALVAEVCDRILVMYCGWMVEEAPVRRLLQNPCHPYTRGLLASIPKITPDKVRLKPIRGIVPNPFAMPGGCSFHPRCDEATDRCREALPAPIDLGGGHRVRCWHAT